MSLLLTQLNLRAQQNPGDSSGRTVQLNEVFVCSSQEEKDPAFNFYRHSKLATTEDILARMPGVNLIKRGAYGMEPVLRNYSNGQTNVMIGGMRMYGACTDKMDPVSIYVEPFNLKSIQVAHGASGAQAGSTIGGQVSLNLQEPEFTCHSKLNAQLAQAFSTVNKAYNSSVAMSQSFQKLAYRFSSTYRKADDYKAGGGEVVKYSGYEKLNTSASLAFRLTSSHMIKADYLGDWGRNIGYPALPMDVGRADANIISLTHQYKRDSSFFQSNEIKFYVNDIYHAMDDTKRPDAPMHMDMPGWSRTYGFYNELKGRKDFKWRVDYHQAHTRADMTMYPVGEPVMYMQTLPSNTLRDLGMALHYDFPLTFRSKLECHSRLDWHVQVADQGPGVEQWNVFGANILEQKEVLLKNFQLAYNRIHRRNVNTKISLGYAERVPTSNERYGYYLYNRQDQYDYIGNLSLKPEQSWQTEFSIKQDLKRLQYNVNIFYHQTFNYIYAYKLDGYSQMTIGAKGLKTYKNINYAVSTGFEANAGIQLFEQVSYLAGARFVYAHTDINTPLPLVPPFKLQEALRFDWQLIRFQVEHDYAASQNRINPDYGDVATRSFHVFNMRVSRNIRVKTVLLQVNVACENIFDAYYREHLDIGQIPRFGRNFLFNLNILF